MEWDGLNHALSVRHKLWGAAATLYASPSMRLEVARIVEGGYSSWHIHERQVNVFSVLAGTLGVEVGDDKQLYVLNRESKPLAIEPAIPHRFVAITPVRLLECYHGTDCEQVDIVRFDVGGVGMTRERP